MPYLGNTPTTQSFSSGTDYFNGNGSQVAFTLSRPVASINDVQVTVNNVVQAPNSGYTISGNTLTFDAAPSAGTNNVYVRYLSTTTQVITPSQNSVSYASLTPDMQQDIGISFKNRIINGDMRIDQRNNGAAVSYPVGAPGNNTYSLDRWNVFKQSGSGAYTVQRSTVAPTGFTNSLLVTVTSAFASTESTSAVNSLAQMIEGFNSADLMWGTANAQPITVSFWVRSSVTGNYTFTVGNSDYNRQYATTYTVNSANTWEYKTITIPGDTTGTWVGATNGVGIRIWFDLGTGTGYYSGAANVWSSSQAFRLPGTIQLLATNGATWHVTGVQLEKGTTATAFDFRSYATELHLCKRYWQFITGMVGTGFASTSIFSNPEFPVEMRSAPTVAITGSINFTYAGVSDHNQSPATVSQVGDIGRNNAFVRFNNYSGITSGVPYLRNTNTNYLILSAEI